MIEVTRGKDARGHYIPTKVKSKVTRLAACLQIIIVLIFANFITFACPSHTIVRLAAAVEGAGSGHEANRPAVFLEQH